MISSFTPISAKIPFSGTPPAHAAPIITIESFSPEDHEPLDNYPINVESVSDSIDVRVLSELGSHSPTTIRVLTPVGSVEMFEETNVF